MKTFISLDLEFNQPSRKIIQVGVCIGQHDVPEDDWVIKKWYVDPYESISEEIVKLTGITNDDIIQHSVPLIDVAADIKKMIIDFDCFVNPVTWGGGDSECLLSAFKEHSIDFPHFGRRHIDVKTIHTFVNMTKDKNKSGGLASVMGQYKLQFKGQAHQADVDAYNTLRLFFVLLRRQHTIENFIKESRLL